MLIFHRRHAYPEADQGVPAVEDAYEDALRIAITRLRAWGMTWDDIGARLGVSGRKAQQRWHHSTALDDQKADAS